MNNNIKTILVVLAAVVLAVFAYDRIDNYLDAKKAAEQEFTEAEKFLATVSASFENILDVENKDTKITFKELFENIDKSLEKSEESIVLIRSSSIDEGWKTSAISYVSAGQDALRSMRSSYQKQLDASNHLEYAQEEVEDYKNSTYNEYTSESDYRRVRKILEESKEKALESRQAELEYFESMKKFSSVSISSRKTLGDKITISKAVVDKVLKKITPSSTGKAK